MPANDDNENEDDAIEGLAQLDQQNPYAGAPQYISRFKSCKSGPKKPSYKKLPP